MDFCLAVKMDFSCCCVLSEREPLNGRIYLLPPQKEEEGEKEMSWKNTSEEVRGKERSTNTDSHIPSFPLFLLFEEEKNLSWKKQRKKFRGISWQRATKTESSKILFYSSFVPPTKKSGKRWVSFIFASSSSSSSSSSAESPFSPSSFHYCYGPGPPPPPPLTILQTPLSKGAYVNPKKMGRGQSDPGWNFDDLNELKVFGGEM